MHAGGVGHDAVHVEDDGLVAFSEPRMDGHGSQHRSPAPARGAGAQYSPGTILYFTLEV